MKLLLTVLGSVVVMLAAGCSPEVETGQTTNCRAPDLMIHYGCPTCHVIPGVPGAAGKVGPSLIGLAQRSYLAGTLQNSPENLVLWIQHPQQIHPGTAMPEMGVTKDDAKDIAMFLQARN